MQYLANENIPLSAILALRNSGIDIHSIKEIFPGAKDETVLALAIKENAILLTFDKDFGEWVFKNKSNKPKGIILLRFTPLSAEHITRELKKLFSIQIAFPNFFAVANEEKVRVVPL